MLLFIEVQTYGNELEPHCNKISYYNYKDRCTLCLSLRLPDLLRSVLCGHQPVQALPCVHQQVRQAVPWQAEE